MKEDRDSKLFFERENIDKIVADIIPIARLQWPDSGAGAVARGTDKKVSIRMMMLLYS